MNYIFIALNWHYESGPESAIVSLVKVLMEAKGSLVELKDELSGTTPEITKI